MIWIGGVFVVSGVSGLGCYARYIAVVSLIPPDSSRDEYSVFIKNLEWGLGLVSQISGMKAGLKIWLHHIEVIPSMTEKC